MDVTWVDSEKIEVSIPKVEKIVYEKSFLLSQKATLQAELDKVNDLLSNFEDATD